MTNAQIISTAGATALLFTVAIAKADVLNLPQHSHAASPVTTWPGGRIDPTKNHQHRTNHHVCGAFVGGLFGNVICPGGAIAHGGVDAYRADSTWMDRSYHVIGGGHAEFGHGHQDIAARYHVHTAVAGQGVTANAAARWNLNDSALVKARIEESFNAWEIVGNAAGANNWPNGDNDHVAGTGVAWHSTVAWEPAETGPHEVHVVLGELDSLGLWDDTDAANLPGLNVIFNGDDSRRGDDVSWYYGTSSDNTVEPDMYDFLSTAIHEVGHVVGLLHFGTFAQGAIMTADGQTTRGDMTMPGGDGHGQGIFRTIDASAIHGVRDLYAIAVPEPASLALLALSGLMFRRRRRQ